MEADRGLSRARPALDDERPLAAVRDQPVLVGLDRRGTMSRHVLGAALLQLLEEGSPDARAVHRRAVERLVADPDELAPACPGTGAAG